MSKAPIEPLPTSPGTTATPPSALTHPTSTAPFQFPTYHSFPPLYTLQPNLTTRTHQFQLWSDLILAYHAHHRLYRLTPTSPPPDLFTHPHLPRSLRADEIATVLEHMSQPAQGSRIEWITPPSSSFSTATRRGGGGGGGDEPLTSTCYVHWRTPGEWADALAGWIDETGQKGAVLTVYEIRAGEAATGREWEGIDEGVLRKALNVLVRRGKAQVFGQEEGAGVKFF